jgi:hypothetical protein
VIPEIRCSGIINCAFAECVKVGCIFPSQNRFEKLLMHQAAAIRILCRYINIQIIRLNQIIKVEFAYDVMV